MNDVICTSMQNLKLLTNEAIKCFEVLNLFSNFNVHPTTIFHDDDDQLCRRFVPQA